MIVSSQLYSQHVEFAFACHMETHEWCLRAQNMAGHKVGVLSSCKII